MDDMIALPNGTRVPLPTISPQRSHDLGWYTDTLQDILPLEQLVRVQGWAFEQSEMHKTVVEYWYAVLVSAVATAAHMTEADFLLHARHNPRLQQKLC